MKLGEWLKARKCGCAEIEKLKAELETAKYGEKLWEETAIEIRNMSRKTEDELLAAKEELKEYKKRVAETLAELEKSKKLFKVGVGDVVYDITLKDKEGKFTTEKPCLETSTVKPVKVTESNFFDIIRRIEKKDVFFDEERAKKHVRKLCEGKK